MVQLQGGLCHPSRDWWANVLGQRALVRKGTKDLAATAMSTSAKRWSQSLAPGPEAIVRTDGRMTASTRVDVMIEMDGSTGQGLVDIAFMNAIGFDASAIGNHEFDLGSDFFAGVIADKAYSPGADFPFLSANLDFSQSLSLDPLFTSDILEDSAFKWQSLPKISRATIVKVNGQSIGILGVTPPNLQIISTPTGVTVIGPDDVSNIEGLASTLQPTVDDLMGLGINKVILISHLKSFASNRELATNLTGVDVIIAGGDETILANADDVLRGSDVADDEYPVLTYGRDGYPVVIVSTKGEYQYVGQLTIQFNSQGRVIPNFDENSNGPISTGTSFVDQFLSGIDRFADGTRAKLVQDLVNDLKAVAALRDSLIFGNSLEYLEGDRELVRTQETNLGNLVADAMLYYAKTTDSSAQISLSNGGGIRASIGVIDPVTLTKKPNEANPFASKLDGDISQLDIENALRFNNGLTLVTVTATELKEILEHGVSSVPNESGGFPQVSGLKFSFDPTQSVGSRVSSVVIVDENGDCIDTVVMNGIVDGVPSRGFRLVTNSYLAGGGDGYPFATLSSANRVDILDSISTRTGSATFTDNGREQDAFAEYLKAKFPDPSSPFKEADTPSAQDERIQDLSVRSETMCS